MKKLCVLGASALLFASLALDEAAAQRGGRGGGLGMGGGGGGFRGAAIGGGGGFRGGGLGMGGGGGFRGPAIGGGFRSAGFSRGGFGFRSPVVGMGVRVAGFRGGGWGWRRGWGWGFPFAGLALAATAGYYGSCWRWDGFEWVNVCYQPYYG